MLRIGRARALIGAAISLVALWLVLRSVDLATTAELLRTADWRWIAVVVAFLCVDLAARALRWQRLLAPIAAVPYLNTLQYLLVGYVFNNVLPARLGELVRSHYAGDREGISRSTTLGARRVASRAPRTSTRSTSQSWTRRPPVMRRRSRPWNIAAGSPPSITRRLPLAARMSRASVA